MATLQKIRNHGVALIVIVGLAMLAFILGDFLNSGSSFFNRRREYVGEIAGHKVHFTEYEAAKDQINDVYKMESGRTDIDEDLAAQLRNQVWQMMMMDYTLRAECEKIGMDVTAEELSELCIGENPHPYILQRRAFQDENGQFAREGLVRFLHSLDESANDPEAAAQMKQAKSYWLYWENAVRQAQMQEKYVGLLQHLVKANPIDAKYAFEARQTSVDADYIVASYYDVPDSLIKISKSDIKRMYKQQKPMYKQTPNRSIEYILFSVEPSDDDFAKAQEELQAVEEEFRTTDDIALVVNTNSDIMYTAIDMSAEEVPELYRDFAFGKGAHKDAFSPLQFVEEEGTYTMARLVECGYSKPDSVCLKAIAQQEGQEDQELGWFRAAALTPEMADKAFAGKIGTRFSIETGYGEQEFEVIDMAKATPKVKLAILARTVTPSSKTYSAIYNSAKQFIVANPTEQAIRDAAKEANMALIPEARMNKNTDKIAQLKNSRPIVRWAFEAKEGDVSDVFECGEQFVVAVLTDVQDGEYAAIEDVKGELIIKARNEKKAERIMADWNGCASLEEAAAKTNSTVQHAENLRMDDIRFANGSMEPAVLGAAMVAEEGAITRPIEGLYGVYMLKVNHHNMAAGEMNVENEMQQLSARYTYTLPYQVMNALTTNAEVVDNRANFQ